jgi:siroheme synthase
MLTVSIEVNTGIDVSIVTIGAGAGDTVLFTTEGVIELVSVDVVVLLPPPPHPVKKFKVRMIKNAK